MQFVREHWFDVGGILGVGILLVLLSRSIDLSSLQTILWLSFASLLFHQVEEYRFPGYFPEMLNRTLFKSSQPDRYPLNPQTAFLINVLLGWVIYLLALLFAEQALWLAIASVLISLGNIIAHVFLFNIKGRTRYNPGMATALVLFLPLSIYFFFFMQTNGLAHPLDYAIGIPLGVALNYFGIVKTIDLLKDKKTTFIFPNRSVEPQE